MFDQEDLLAQLGSAATARVTERLKRFAYIPLPVVERLASSEILTENWGPKHFVLLKYLAVNIGWSIEQGRYTHSDNQLYIAAGSLQTRYGTPVYLVFEPNKNPNQQPWILRMVGSQISAPQLPLPPAIPTMPEIPRGAEIVMMHDHILGDNGGRVSFLQDTPPVAQMCAVSGAIQWSFNRELQIPYWYYGKVSYLVPLYLQSRENITLAPDVIAPVEVSQDSLLVRTVLAPHMPYANARVAVKRHDQLPAWMLDCWNTESATMQEDEAEDAETPETE